MLFGKDRGFVFRVLRIRGSPGRDGRGLHRLGCTEMTRSQPNIIVIGAGLQGSSVALALAAKGIRSVLLERQPQPLLAASLRNEGKIHLGFVYALSAGTATTETMLRGATSFAGFLDAWCGPLPWQQWQSAPFRYLVMPDSLLSADQLAAAYCRLDETAAQIATDGPLDYLGEPLGRLWSEPTPASALVRMTQSLPWFETVERSIDPRLLTAAVRKRVEAEPLIDLRCGLEVQVAEARGSDFQLTTSAGLLTADAVVNCAWEQRQRLDRMGAAAVAEKLLSYRVKHQILIRPRRPTPLLPVTMVQGPFGDIVPWPDGSIYLSWYPTGRTYFGSSPPPEPLDDPAVARQVAEESLTVMADLFPDLQGATIVSSLPGIIVARGDSDVDRPDSGLHDRAAIGVRSSGCWWTIETGKLTTAPWFAEQAAQQIAHTFGI